MAEQPRLRAEEVASVLAGGEPPGGEAGSSTVYSLRHPVAIAPEHEARARKRLELIADALREALRQELGADVALQVQGFQQEQVDHAVATVPAPAWVLCFMGAGESGGLALALEPLSALALVELALGGAGSCPTAGREPTPLESRVLNKLCSALAGPLSARVGIGLPTARFEKGAVPAELAAPGQTVGVGLLEMRIAQTERRGLLLATPNLLREFERRPALAEQPEPGPLARGLSRVGVEVRPVVEAGTLTVGDLAALQTGKVLRLEAREDQVLVLHVLGRDVFKGHIVLEGGRALFRASWRRGRRTAPRNQEEK